MITTISISVIAVFFAYISSKPKFRLSWFFGLAFILVTILQVIHYDYGSDYMQYYNQHFLYTGTVRDFIELNRMGYGAYRSIGWAVLNRLYPGEMGFFFIVALISVIENCIYYGFIVQNVERRDRWKSFAIYIFSTTLYVINFSALRQGLAVALGVLAMMMVCKKKPILAMAVVALAITIHSSAFVMLPFIVLSMIPLGDGRKYAIIISLVSFILFISNTLVGDTFTRLARSIPFIGRQYGVYYEDGVQSTDALGLGFALRLVMFITLLYFIAFKSEELSYENRQFVLLSCIPLCLIPFQLIVSGLISRVEYFFLAFQIVSVPVVYGKIKNSIIHNSISIVYVFLLLYAYYKFFFVTEWSAMSYAHFHTIFDVMFK